MQDTDFKTWALIIALALGGTFQIAKSFRPSPVRQTADVSASFAGESEDEPYSVRDEQGARAHRPPTDPSRPRANVEVSSDQMAKFLAQNQAPTLSGTFGDKAAVPKKKDDEKCVKKIDPKTGKESEVCKKKKKKKKADKVEDAPVAVTHPSKPSTDNQNDSNTVAWGVANVVATNKLGVTNAQADTAFESLQYWEKILLDSPNLDETKRFIDHFQRNLVSSDVYYQITKEMMANSNSDMKLLGVMCASQNNSVTSFQLLADLIQTQASGTAIRTQADAALARYTDISSLTILAGVMRANESTYSVTLAVQKLSVAANRYLTVATTTPTTPDQTKPNQTAARNKTYFTRFVTILQTLAKSNDSTLKSTATGTLTNLQTLLNQSGTPTTAVAQS